MNTPFLLLLLIAAPALRPVQVTSGAVGAPAQSPVIAPTSVAVSGEVKNPGRYEYKGELTVAGAIELAGGPTERAAIGRAQIQRTTAEGKDKRLKVKLTDAVKDKDTVIVPARWF